MNYSLNYAFRVDSPLHMLAQNCKFGKTQDFDCDDSASCAHDILKDLAKIDSMGFNMIRPDITPIWDKNFHVFKICGWEIQPNGWKKDSVIFNRPYSTDPITQEYFRYIDWVTEKARQLGMYIMLNGTLGDHTAPGADDAYREFLTALGNHFKNNQNIAFYDILSEPAYNYSLTISKKDACNLVADWYDTLKAVDPNHLITGCNIGFEEINFELSLLKLDFSQPHPYSFPVTYDADKVINSLNRVKGQFYWLSRNCPMPWIQGEISFKASDEYMVQEGGTTIQQKTFVDNILAATRDYGGSGFTWWDYQDSNYPNPVNGTGLIKLFCDISNPNANCEKPAAESFRNYLNPYTHQPPAPNPANNIIPPDYYDPYRHAFFNPTHHNAVSGFIKDENNQPIVDARVTAVNWNTTIFSDPENIYINSFIYTFTDNNGHFEVIPYNWINIGDDRIVNIKVSPVGCEYFDRGITWKSDAQMQTNIGTVNVKKKPFTFDLNLANQTVSGTNKIFKAWSSIEASNFTIQPNGSADFRARDSIRLSPGFNATQGSHVTVYPAETFRDCNDFASFAMFRSGLLAGDANSDPYYTAQQLELQFKPVANHPMEAYIMPNPNHGTFTLSINNCCETLSVKVKIKNLLGATLMQLKMAANTETIDISRLSKGVYMVEISNGDQVIVKKCIIQ